MAPVPKTEGQPAVSLLLVKPSISSVSSPLNLENVGDTSREGLMEMIYKLLLLVGQNMSIIQNCYAENQLSQVAIAQAFVSSTQQQIAEATAKEQELEKEQKQAQTWQTFTEVVKYIGIAIGFLVGALLCETPLGFLVLAAVVAFMASPLFDKTVSALGGALGKATGNSTLGNILAQVIVIVALTIVTCGAEGLTTGLSRLATTAGEDSAAGLSEAAIQATRQASREAEEQAAEQIAQQGADNGASKATNATTSKTKVSASDFKPRWTYTSAAAFTQSVLSTNLAGELITQAIEAIPGGNEDAKKWVELILTLIADIALAAISFKGVSSANAGSVMAELLGNSVLLRGAAGSFEGAVQILQATSEGTQGYYQYEQGQTQAQLAPIEATIAFGQSFSQIFTQLTNLAQQTYKATAQENQVLFSTDFSADWKACVAAQQYQG